MLKTWALATRLLWREWRAGEWLMVVLAIVTSVAALTGLHFYTERIDRALQHQSAILLGGDLVVSSSNPIPDTWRQQATTLGLKHADIWTYPSMVSAKQQLQLVSVNAVSSDYPLMNHGEQRPQAASVWVENRLLPLLALHINDQLTIGSAAFNITRTLPADAEALNTGWLIAPRVLMRLEDVASTKTVISGSRVDYRLLLTGSVQALQKYRAWIKPKLSMGQQLIDIHSNRSPMRERLQQMTDYLHLLLLACLMMSGVAIAMSSKQYLQTHFTHVALWRCLGIKKTAIIHIILIQFFIIALVSGTMGSLIGYGLQFGIEHFLEAELQLSLPAASATPYLTGIVISALLLFGFAYPVINELPQTPPLLLWRNEVRLNKTRDYFYPFLTLLGMVAFILVFIGSTVTMLFYAAAMLFSVVLVYLLSIFLLRVLRKIANSCDGVLRHGVNQIIRHPNTVSMQLTGFTLILASLFILGFVRTSIINQWQNSLPPNTPNYFVMNIAPEDVPVLSSFFVKHHIDVEKIDPIVRGRMIALNGEPIMSAIPAIARGHNTLHRELNLSWMTQFPSDNKIVNGPAWSASDNGKAYVSVEKSVAEELGFKLGDKITFRIGDQSITAAIRSFRTLNWSSFHPNFYMIFPPGVLEEFPTTYVTSFHLRADQTSLLNQLSAQFPNITILDMASILTQVQEIVAKATLAMQYIFVFLTIVAVLIFVISLQATRDERRQTYKLMRVLGASRNYIYKLIAVEAVTIVLLVLFCAGVISVVVADQLSRLLLAF